MTVFYFKNRYILKCNLKAEFSTSFLLLIIIHISFQCHMILQKSF